MNTLGIILARAGSVGLPNKHLLSLVGRPVIDYTFQYAREARRLSRVVVTSDCAHILTLARNEGFEIVERPAALASSEASVQETCLHAMESVEARSGFHADAIVVLYGNVAVRDPTVIDRSVELLEATGCDSVRSLTPVGKWHPAWMHRLDGETMRPLHPNSIHRRQDLEPIYLHDGAAIAIARRSMLRVRHDRTDPHTFFGVDRRGVVSDMDQTVEIDHQRDLYWAEAVLRERGLVERQSTLAGRRMSA